MPGDNAGLPWLSERVALRRLSTDDLVAFQAYRTDHSLAKYQGWLVVEDDAALTLLQREAQAPMFHVDVWNQLAIVNEHQILIGDMGICTHASWAELGYTLNRQYHGRGYATEAVRLAVRQLFALTHVWAVHGMTDIRNAASVRVLERAGFTLIDTRTHDHTTELVYQVTRDTID